MAFARRDEDSDVYVYLSGAGHFECSGCSRGQPKQQWTRDILKHLMEHRQAGDKVPDYCFNRLRAQRDENDAWIRRRIGLRKKRK